MCAPLECIFLCELSLPLTGTPGGRRNSEMLRHIGLARIASCSPDPYATFEWMCGPLECIFASYAFHKLVHLVKAVTQRCAVVEGCLGSHRILMIHTQLLSGCVAL